MRLFVNGRLSALALLLTMLLIVLFSISGTTAWAKGPDKDHGKKDGHDQGQQQRRGEEDHGAKVKMPTTQNDTQAGDNRNGVQVQTVATQNYRPQVDAGPQNTGQPIVSVSQAQPQQTWQEDYAQADADVGTQAGIESEERAEQGADQALVADSTTGTNGTRLLTTVKGDSGSRGVRSTVEAANADWTPLVPIMLILGSIGAAIAFIASRMNPES